MFSHKTGHRLTNNQVFEGSGRSVEIRPNIRSIKGSGEDDGHWDVVYNQKQLTRFGKDLLVGLVGIPLGLIGYAIISTFMK